jgi:hypothetical protein
MAVATRALVQLVPRRFWTYRIHDQEFATGLHGKNFNKDFYGRLQVAEAAFMARTFTAEDH